MLVSSELLVSITSPSFFALHLLVSEIAAVMHEFFLIFYKNYIVYYNVYHDVFIGKHVYTKFHLDWLLCQ